MGPKLIALELRPGNVSRVVEEIVRVQVAVAQEFKDVAMEGVAAGSGDGVHYVAHAPAVLGRESVGLNLEFLGFVNRRNIDDAVPVFVLPARGPDVDFAHVTRPRRA